MVIAEKAIVTGGSASTVTISSGPGWVAATVWPLELLVIDTITSPARVVSTTAVTTGPLVSWTSSSVPDVAATPDIVITARWPSPIGVASASGTARTAAAPPTRPRSATAIGDVVALIAIGGS